MGRPDALADAGAGSGPRAAPASILKPSIRRLGPRRLLTSALFFTALLAVVCLFLINIDRNLTARGLSLSFDFLGRPAGFDIPTRVIAFSPRDTYAVAALVGITNTLLVSGLAVVTATLIGFLAGACLLSPNPLLARVVQGAVELVRNTPQLLQILFVYTVLLRALPAARDSLSAGGLIFLNVRGLFLPGLVPGAVPPHLLVPAPGWAGVALLAGFAGLALPIRRRWLAPLAGLAVALAILGALLGFGMLRLDPPVLRGFNFRGGLQVGPELVSLWIGLSVYGAAFIADGVRGAVLAVPRGQEEAALSLGLSPTQAFWLVRMPQALRILLPPLVGQYLNIVKSSTLGLAIAYPEIMAVVAGTTLNQTGHAIETMLIVLLFFVALNLVISAGINLYERRLARRA
ncbi:amino acid ABC transporter permease [Alsobacter sp. SYSU BS001988]